MGKHDFTLIYYMCAASTYTNTSGVVTDARIPQLLARLLSELCYVLAGLVAGWSERIGEWGQRKQNMYMVTTTFSRVSERPVEM